MRLAIWSGFSLHYLCFQECHQRVYIGKAMALPCLNIFQAESPHSGLSGPGRAFLPQGEQMNKA